MKIIKGVSLKKVLAKEMADPEFRFYFERAKAIRKIAQLVRTAREKAGLTQAELAKKIGSSQPMIARLESSNDTRIPSLDLLERIATVCTARLSISFEYSKAA